MVSPVRYRHPGPPICHEDSRLHNNLGKNEAELEERVTTVLQRCKEKNITISRKKFEMGSSIHFAVHMISDSGIRPDAEKFRALRLSTTTKCQGTQVIPGIGSPIRGLRTGHGLSNQPPLATAKKRNPMGLASRTQAGLRKHEESTYIANNATAL